MPADTLDAAIARVMFHKEDKFDPAGTPYLIARTTAGQTIKGKMLRPVEGCEYRFWGEWRAQKGYDEPAFVFVSFEPVVERSASGAEQYLAAHVTGIGRVKAAQLAERFGADTIDILSATPERALEVPGLTERTVEALRQHFESETRIDPRAHARLMDLFARDGHRIPKKVITKLLKSFGSSAPDMICQRPYLLIGMHGIGWKTCDAFALATAKYGPQGRDRQLAALGEAMANVVNEGHTVAFRADVEARAGALLGYHPPAEAWAAFVADDGAVDLPGGRCTTPRLFDAEISIANSLRNLAGAARPLGFTLDTAGLAPDQIEALQVIEQNGVALLIGPPGTGKTYTVSSAVKSMLANGITQIQAVAPTGKASKRLAELLANAGIDPETVPSTTIHKALCPAPADEAVGIPGDEAKHGREREAFRFSKGPQSLLECAVLIVDETSMVDVRLGASLLAAVAPGTRVLFVGDENQLPSVGPGSVLRDLIAGGLPTARLRDIKRSDGGGRVVRACHAIVAGREPEPAVNLAPPTENWLHIEEGDPARIAETIVELHRLANKFDPFWGYQVVSAQKGKHPFACDFLNQRLSDLLNPDPNGATASDPTAPPFRPGDKVIRLKNGVADEMAPPLDFEDADWWWRGEEWKLTETPIVNGDMGTVEAVEIQGNKSWVVVRFRDPERLCRLPYGEHHLALAYAVTVHKAQGSGFPVVIVPCHESFYFDTRTGQGLWCRELYYTAISRAEQILITVGQWSAVRKAIGRKTVHVRRTRLAGLMTGEDSTRPVPPPPPNGLATVGGMASDFGAIDFEMEATS